MMNTELIEKYRDINVDYKWWDSTYDDFNRICEILGIELDRHEPTFSGFWSQGDGASFTGGFYPKNIEDAPEKIRTYAPKDEELHRIADKLADLNLIYLAKFWGRIARSTSNYVHSNTMSVEIGEWDEEEGFWSQEVFDIVESEFQQLMRDLADWLYSTLHREYDHLTSDEAVWESIVANELEEDEDDNH